MSHSCMNTQPACPCLLNFQLSRKKKIHTLTHRHTQKPQNSISIIKNSISTGPAPPYTYARRPRQNRPRIIPLVFVSYFRKTRRRSPGACRNGQNHPHLPFRSTRSSPHTYIHTELHTQTGRRPINIWIVNIVRLWKICSERGSRVRLGILRWWDFLAKIERRREIVRIVELTGVYIEKGDIGLLIRYTSLYVQTCIGYNLRLFLVVTRLGYICDEFFFLGVRCQLILMRIHQL